MISTAGSEVICSYGLVFALDEEMEKLDGMFGNDLEPIDATVTWELPVPATYVVGTDGVVTFASVSTSTSPPKVVAQACATTWSCSLGWRG